MGNWHCCIMRPELLPFRVLLSQYYTLLIGSVLTTLSKRVPFRIEPNMKSFSLKWKYCRHWTLMRDRNYAIVWISLSTKMAIRSSERGRREIHSI